MRGLNRSTISRQIAHGAIPTHDGLLDPKEADQAREKNLNGIRREQASRRKVERAATKPAPAVEFQPAVPFVGSDAHQVVIDTLRQIASPEAVLRFAAVALRAGCTPTQAYVTAVWYSCAPCLALAEVDGDDLGDFEAPTYGQWRNLLGKDFDLNAADLAHDAATVAELQPRV